MLSVPTELDGVEAIRYDERSENRENLEGNHID
jgi:hypothetical protein